MRKLDLMETWGTGFKRMSEDCAGGGYPAPDWVEMSSVIRTVFRPHPEATASTRLRGERSDVEDVGVNDGANDGVNVGGTSALNERQSWFLSQLAGADRKRSADIARQFGVTTQQLNAMCRDSAPQIWWISRNDIRSIPVW